MSIFIITGDAGRSLALQQALQKLGYAVAGAAGNGDEALRSAANQRPDLVLLDIALAGRPDAFDTALYLREMHALPVIFLAEQLDEAEFQRAQGCAPAGYLVGPLRQDGLRAAIERAQENAGLEKKLRHSEARFNELFEISLDGIVATDLAGNVTTCNPAFCRLVGCSMAELTGMNLAEITQEIYFQVEKLVLDDLAAEQGYSNAYFQELFHISGARIPVSVRARIRRDGQGEPVGYWRIIRDITKTKAAEKKILRQEELAQNLVRFTANLNLKLELPKILEFACAEIAQVMDVEAAQVTLYDPEKDTLAVAHYYGPLDAEEIASAPYPFTMYKQLAASSTPYLLVTDLQGLLKGHPYHPFLVKHDIRSAIIVNLTCEQRLIGTLDLASIGRRREFAEDELAFLITFANQAATAIDHAILYQQARSRADELEILGELSSALRLAISRREMLPTLLNGIMNLTKADAGIIYLLDKDGVPLDTFQYAAADLPTADWFSPGGENWSRVLASERFLYDPLPGSQRDPQEAVEIPDQPFVYKILVPLRSANALSAVIVLGYVDPPRMELQEHHILTSLAEMGGNALHRSGVMEMLEQRVSDRTRELTTLYDLTVFVNTPMELENILDGALRKSLHSVSAQCGIIYRCCADVHSLHLEAQVAMPLELLSSAYELEVDAALKTWLETSTIPWLAHQGDEISTPIKLDNASAFASVINLPIRFEGSLLGLLCIFWQSEISLTAESIALLIAIAERIGSAIQNDVLRKKAQNTALLEERQRLARELHDSVTQSLYSLTLLAEAGKDLLALGNLARLEKCLNDLGDNSLQALKEMRMLIFELRPPLVGSGDLAKALQDRLEAVERRAGIKARLEVQGTLALPGRIQEELFQVAREALNNSLKHSGSNAVLVSLKAGENEFELAIEDNGAGFDPQSAYSGGMGIGTMRERAERLGGTLEIESIAGKGTKVLIKLKLDSE